MVLLREEGRGAFTYFHSVCCSNRVQEAWNVCKQTIRLGMLASENRSPLDYSFVNPDFTHIFLCCFRRKNFVKLK